MARIMILDTRSFRELPVSPRTTIVARQHIPRHCVARVDTRPRSPRDAMSFGRANGRSPIRPTWVNSNDCFEYRSKQHGAYAFAHPAEGDPTFGRDPTDAFYEGVRMRQWHGQQSVSGQDIGIGRHHPPYVCAVTSPHMFATALLVTVNNPNPNAENGVSTPCLLMPHRVLRGLEHDFELMRDAMDVVTRVVPPSTHSAPKKGEFKIIKLVLDPWRLFEFSPAPNANANETHDAKHMDYALVAIDPKTLTDEIPREWLRSLEDAAAFGYHPARDAHNLLGVAPKRWLDPAFCAVGKNAVGINWRRGRVVRNERDAREGVSETWERRFENVGGSGFESTFEGLPPAHASAGGAVLACMTDESARAAGTRNSMAADTRFAAAVRPYATPLIGYGDWGVLVGMHRGAVFGNEGAGEPMSDVLRITDIVADLARRRAARETTRPAIEASSVAATSRDGEASKKSSPGMPEMTTREEASTGDASIAAPAAERRVSWLEGDETLEDAALRKRRQWVDGMTIKK